MNYIKKTILALASIALVTPTVDASRAEATREHRAVWVTPYLTGNWPSSPLTSETAVTNARRIINSRMEKFKEQNINIVYYHVRSFADALYKSSYEPWSYKIAGTRGGTPAGDPLEIIIEAAHANGIEVYAWVNPYRYSSNGYHGTGELNYETTHPDWLCKSGDDIILNPGKPEVTQRIVDVISEVAKNYDIDGVLYDDYFYINSMSTSLDKTEYDAYKAGAGDNPMSLADWRRANVNDMVHRVNVAIKSIKPYLNFGISPAGVACPAGTTEKYGLPMVSGDWQYNGIYSDPLSWLAAGDIDFISPQIYWPNRWDELASWWSKACQKFGRHNLPSVDLSTLDNGTEEFMREALYVREQNPADASGFVFFQYGTLINYYEKVYDKSMAMPDNFARGVFTTKALTPLRTWTKSVSPVMTSNVRRDGSNLVWDEVKGMRYTVYAVPEGTEASFGCQREFLDGVSYTNSYAIPTDKATGYKWAVAVYDRYGNEYSPLFEGATATTIAAPELIYPVGGERAPFMADFTWKGQGSRFILELATDEAFDNIISTVETCTPTVNITDLTALTDGNTYYWRVRVSSPNAPEVTSAVESFMASKFALTAPSNNATGVDYNAATLSCDVGLEGTVYTFIVSNNSSLANPVYTAQVNTPTTTVPRSTLSSGTTYYAGVTAVLGSTTVTSDVVKFSTLDRTDYTAPKFVIPSAESGTTVYTDQALTVEPWDGMRNVKVELSTSTSFPVRGATTSRTLSDFGTATESLSDIKLSSKPLVDGTTYYTRCRGGYNVTGSTATKYTAYSPVYSFVYSSNLGVDDIVGDAQVAIYVDSEGTLHFGSDVKEVSVYTLAGALVATYTLDGANELSLSHLTQGAYLVTLKGDAVTTLKMVR